MTTTQTHTPSTAHTALFGVRAQVVSAGLVWSLLVLGPRWADAPQPLAELFGGLTFFADLPVWTAAIGALVAVLALVPLLLRRGR